VTVEDEEGVALDRLSYAHVRFSKLLRVPGDVNNAEWVWVRQFDLAKQRVELLLPLHSLAAAAAAVAVAAAAVSPGAAPPPAPAHEPASRQEVQPVVGIDRPAVHEVLKQGGGVQRAGRMMLESIGQQLGPMRNAAMAVPESDDELERRRLLERKIERPNKVAVFGSSGSGKSYTVARITDMLMPPDLVDPTLPPEPRIRTRHERASSDADMDGAQDVLRYAADLHLPHFDDYDYDYNLDDGGPDQDLFNINEGILLFPHAEGGSCSTVPINAIPTCCGNDPRFVVRVNLIRPSDAIKTVRQGLDRQNVGEGAVDGEGSEGGEGAAAGEGGDGSDGGEDGEDGEDGGDSEDSERSNDRPET